MSKYLRQTTYPQFINKNAELTGAEHDATLIALQQEINTALGFTEVPAFDSGKLYQLDEFVYYNYAIYKFISDVPASAIVPGTNTEKWVVSSLPEFLTSKNFIVVTALELSTELAAGTLLKGRYYFVNDDDVITNLGCQILLFAAETDKLSLLGTGYFLVPDFQNVGNYIAVTDFTSNIGLWKSSRGTLNYLGSDSFVAGETITGVTSGATAVVVTDTHSMASPEGGVLSLIDIVGTFLDSEVIDGSTSPAASAISGTVTYTFNPQLGDVVIWNGKQWKKKNNDVTSTDPETDGTNYLPLAYSILNGYILDVDIIGFDATDFVDYTDIASFLWRKDKRNNLVYNPLDFQWGNDLVFKNRCDAGVTLDMLNFYGTLKACDFSGFQTISFDLDTGTYIGLSFRDSNNTVIGKRKQDLIVGYTSLTTLGISYTELGLDNYLFTSGSFTLDTATIGADGMDAGTLSANTWYYVWFISKSDYSVPATLGSLSSTAPTLPAGYTHKRFLGAFKTDAAAKIISYNQLDNEVIYGVNDASLKVYDNIGATASGGTEIDLLGAIPPNLAAGTATSAIANVKCILELTNVSSGEFSLSVAGDAINDDTTNPKCIVKTGMPDDISTAVASFYTVNSSAGKLRIFNNYALGGNTSQKIFVDGYKWIIM